jgi:protein-S-isoprenylcysteine O-methyltransferase Ste14
MTLAIGPRELQLCPRRARIPKRITPTTPAVDYRRTRPTTMTIQRILQFVLVIIVLMVGFSLLVFLLQIGQALLSIGLRLLLILLVIAAVLRFFEILRNKRR